MKATIQFISCLALIITCTAVGAQTPPTLQQVMNEGNSTDTQLQHTAIQGIRIINKNITPAVGTFNALLMGQYGGNTQYIRFVPFSTGDIGSAAYDWGNQFSYDFDNTRWYFQGDVDFGGTINQFKVGNGVNFNEIWTASHVDTEFRIFQASTGGTEFSIKSGDGNYLNSAVYVGGKLGIGTADPSALLEIESNDQPALQINNKKLSSSWADDESYGELLFSSDDGSGLGAGVRGYVKVVTPNNYGAIGDMVFGTTDVANLSERMRITSKGNIGIGTTTPTNKLEVNGTIRSKEVKVEATNWPDYVFATDYNLLTLEETEAYIKANNHLPEMPSAAEMEANGVQLGEMNRLLLLKIEELTLHTIRQEKLLEEQGKLIQQLLKAASQD